MSSLFVGRIPRGTAEKELEEIFSKIGKLNRCEIKRDGYGFIDYEDKLDAEDAIKSLHGYEINGGRLVVEFAKGPGNGGPRRDRREATGGCFKCGEPGHWARDCPDGGRGGGYGRDRIDDRAPRRSYRSRSRSRDRRHRDDRSRSRDRYGESYRPSRYDSYRDRSRSPRRYRDDYPRRDDYRRDDAPRSTEYGQRSGEFGQRQADYGQRPADYPAPPAPAYADDAASGRDYPPAPPPAPYVPFE